MCVHTLEGILVKQGYTVTAEIDVTALPMTDTRNSLLVSGLYVCLARVVSGVPFLYV